MKHFNSSVPSLCRLFFFNSTYVKNTKCKSHFQLNKWKGINIHKQETQDLLTMKSPRNSEMSGLLWVLNTRNECYREQVTMTDEVSRSCV